jgi:hypothetical protein
VPVAAALHRSDQPQQLVIRTTLQRQRGGGLASIRYGAEAPLAALYRTQQNWRNNSAIVYSVSLLLMGGLAGGLWLRQRDALYGCFALAALSGVTRNLDRVWPEVPVPWPLWGALVAVCYACHIGLIARFVLLVLDRNPPWLVRSIYGALALSVTLACASFALARPLLWTIGLVVLQVTAIVCLPYVIHGALVARRRIAGVLMAAGMLAILAGAHDLLLVRMGLFGGAYYTLTPHAMFFFVMILAGPRGRALQPHRGRLQRAQRQPRGPRGRARGATARRLRNGAPAAAGTGRAAGAPAHHAGDPRRRGLAAGGPAQRGDAARARPRPWSRST